MEAGAGAESEGGYLGVQYSAFTAVLIEAMRALAARLTPPPRSSLSSSSSSAYSASAGTEADESETEELAALRKAVQELSEAVAAAEAGAGAVARAVAGAVAGSRPYENSSRGAELPLGLGF